MKKKRKIFSLLFTEGLGIALQSFLQGFLLLFLLLPLQQFVITALNAIAASTYFTDVADL